MRLRALVMAGLALTPSAVVAQQRECATIRAMANADGRNFTDLSFTLSGAGVVVRAGRNPVSIPNPAGCDLGAEADSTRIACAWQFADYASANGFYQAFLERMESCLAADIPQVDNASTQPNYLIMRRHRLDSHGVPRGTTALSFYLVEWTYRPSPDEEATVSYHVNLSFDFSADDPEPGSGPDAIIFKE